jgi:flagellar hook assembly protein FlgD
MAFALGHPSPNPAKGTFTLSFDVAKSAGVKVNVLDLQGREVAVLAEGEYKPGRHSVRWNARAGRGALPAGMYFLRYRAGGHTFARRLVLVR